MIETRATIFSILASKLRVFGDTGVSYITSRTSFNIKDIGKKKTAMSGKMIKTEEIDYFSYIYTFKNDNKFITYMSIKNLINNDVLQNLYGNKTTDK